MSDRFPGPFAKLQAEIGRLRDECDTWRERWKDVCKALDAEQRRRVPYPDFCSQPAICSRDGRCARDPCCID